MLFTGSPLQNENSFMVGKKDGGGWKRVEGDISECSKYSLLTPHLKHH